MKKKKKKIIDYSKKYLEQGRSRFEKVIYQSST